MNPTPSRRQFLKTTSLGLAPLILPPHVWAVDSAPGSKITMGSSGFPSNYLVFCRFKCSGDIVTERNLLSAVGDTGGAGNGERGGLAA